MKVEIIGGPKDGSVMEVPDHWRDIAFVIAPDLRDFLPVNDPQECMQISNTSVLIPIEWERHRRFVRWPKGAL